MAFAKAIQTASTTPRARELASAFGVEDITTPMMSKAVEEWFREYYNRERTDDSDASQRIPYVIVNKITRATFSEYTAESDDTFAQSVLDAIGSKHKTGVQQSLIGGESLLKPVFTRNGSVKFSVINRSAYLVFGRDEDDILTDIGTSETTNVDGYQYTLLERRTVDADGYLTITSMLYRSMTAGVLGDPVPLSSLDKYAELEPSVTYSVPIGSIGLIPLRTPMENCIDGSADAVSVYAAAMGLIRSININEAQINSEFSRGESRIIVSGDMMETDERGNREFRDHVFSGLDDNPANIGVTIFSPELREQSFHARKTEYLRNMETLIGLKRGLLSDVETAERTATEITSSAGDYNLTIEDFQDMWEAAAREAVRVCGILGRLYGIFGAAEIPDERIIIGWGDGILYNVERANQEMIAQLQMGLLAPERYLGWYYDMPHETPEERQAVRTRFMPTLDDMLEIE